jgi:WD40 repeat protein
MSSSTIQIPQVMQKSQKAAYHTVQSISFSPCGTAIATSCDDSNIHIWNAQGLGDDSSNPEFAAAFK